MSSVTRAVTKYQTTFLSKKYQTTKQNYYDVHSPKVLFSRTVTHQLAVPY